MITLDEIESALEPDSLAFYSSRCGWWTTSPSDLGETPGEISIPCCPYCGSPLFQAPAEEFISSARANPGYYGPGGLETFALGYHSNSLHARSWTDIQEEPARFQRQLKPLSTAKSIRCGVCFSEFSEAETVGVNSCPVCNYHGAPMSIDQDCTVKINWHELRILGIWAENWARSIDRDGESKEAGLLIDAITRRLEMQYPKNLPLTLEREIRQLQEDYPSAELRTEDGEIIVPKRNEKPS